MKMGSENQSFRRAGFYVRFYFSFVAGNARYANGTWSLSLFCMIYFEKKKIKDRVKFLLWKIRFMKPKMKERRRDRPI